MSSGARYFFVPAESCPFDEQVERLETESLAGDLVAVVDGQRPPSCVFGVIPLSRVQAVRLFGGLAVADARAAAGLGVSPSRRSAT